MTSKKTRRNFILSSIAVASGIAGAKAIEQQDREIAAAPNNQGGRHSKNARTTVRQHRRESADFRFGGGRTNTAVAAGKRSRSGGAN